MQTNCTIFVVQNAHICAMDVKEYLLSKQDVILSDIAKRMYPNNKFAKDYLDKKLHNRENRRFSKKDAQLAKAALSDLGCTLINLTIADKY